MRVHIHIFLVFLFFLEKRLNFPIAIRGQEQKKKNNNPDRGVVPRRSGYYESAIKHSNLSTAGTLKIPTKHRRYVLQRIFNIHTLKRRGFNRSTHNYFSRYDELNGQKTQEKIDNYGGIESLYFVSIC